MRDEDPTEAESTFFTLLSVQVPGLEAWYHFDEVGSPWMIVSHDFVVGDAVRKTLRLDYDGHSLRGGWSPACLNWDDGVRAADAHIDTSSPDGLAVDDVSVAAAAAVAAEWFRRRIAHPGLLA
ncbi:hypothetical protein [Orlajensenia leifsoniae]|uniref:Uncharacterized protein n=1 Tax=Orlajensenia leifsoniae TaxID=2561933 RepID=A0A4Y9QW18_9MICO|nr:hypothetical protein [Leifsonia flava]TFV95286.1 hypothetical protein E4M00_14630 [Leifsonia flava]